MMTILSTLGGAAAMKLLNKREKMPTDVKELKKQEEQLRKLVVAMEKEVQDHTAEKESALAELRRQAEELQAQVAELAAIKEENNTLKEQNIGLKDVVSTQEQHVVALTGAHLVVLQENNNLKTRTSVLTAEVESLKEEHSATVREFEAQLHELRGAVAAVVERMLAHSITDAEAAAAVRALGCEIEYIEAPPASAVEPIAAQEPAKEVSWTQPGLLLGTAEGRERLQKLVASGMLRNTDSTGKAATRIPVITFPDHLMAAGQRVAGMLSARGANANSKVAGSLDQGASADSVTQRDQQQAPAAPPTRSRAPPTIATGTTPTKGKGKANSGAAGVSWTYALQGGSGSTYLAKVPVVGGDQPASHFATSPSLAHALPAGSSMSADSMHESLPFTTSHDMGLIKRP